METSLDALLDEGLDIASKYDLLTRDNPLIVEEEEECPQ